MTSAGSTRSRCSARSAWWEGDLDEVERLANERLAIAERIGRADLQSGVLLELNDVYNARLEPERALRAARARDRARRRRAGARRRGAGSLRAVGRQAAIEGRLVDAEAALEEARALFAESGAALTLARTLNWLGIVVWEQARPRRAPRRSCARRSACSSRSRTGARSSRASACSPRCCSTRGGSRRRSGSRSRRARRSARATSSSARRPGSRSGSCGPRRGRDDEAERLLREADEILRPTGFRRHRIAPLEALAAFLRARDRDDEAVEVEEALGELLPSAGCGRLRAPT